MNLHLGKEFRLYVHVEFERLEDKLTCIVSVEKSLKRAYVSFEDRTEFYIRAGNSSQPLNVKEATEYIANHWK
jgi:hypothetical protein